MINKIFILLKKNNHKQRIIKFMNIIQWSKMQNLTTSCILATRVCKQLSKIKMDN